MAEADESDGQFVRLPSSIAVITNIDREHLDYYPDLDAIKDGFVEYANKVPFYGSVVLCWDDKNVRDVAARIKRRKLTYSLGADADVVGTVIDRSAAGTRFSVAFRGEGMGEILLTIPGDHNVRNALAAVAVGLEMEISFAAIQEGLEAFQGVGRRFEIKGETSDGVLVVDDYGHHPTEITATVQAALNNYRRRLFVLFQPHRYSRTVSVADEFTHCFDGAHRVYITDIYPAGEAPIPGVNAMTIIERVEKSGAVDVSYAPSFDEMVEKVCGELKPGDMVITMGAGDIFKAGDALLERLGVET
ncbi:MAG: UDP-N-acetylmuramate--L-alanine ligase [Candidatus Krumholzibacteriota bacterium]|nr:UDP-N-acetylmuramate--L-alanine ligase [Candidatus Krumholzibacteriota bacterium]